MDLTTRYLGLTLAHPIVLGASPLVDRLDLVKRLEDAGAAAITMHSLFEEQILLEQRATLHHMHSVADTNAEALSYFPAADDYHLGPEEYLLQIHRIKSTVDVPVIASLNGATGHGWVEYARAMAQAGADALELNLYYMATDLARSGQSLEDHIIEVVSSVKQAVRIPVSCKLSPFYSSLSHLASRLDGAGVDGLVLFNRFYQPDIDVEALEVIPKLALSDSSELLLRLRWLAVLSGRVRASLACSGGVHTALDVVKAVMSGAHATQVVSAVLHKGPDAITKMVKDLKQWLEDHEYESVKQMQGSMSQIKVAEPAAFERANYMKSLESWRPDPTGVKL
jgi:dihydroorotate dehydrogenase (fumarate)